MNLMADPFDEVTSGAFSQVESMMGQDAYQASVEHAKAHADSVKKLADAEAALMTSKMFFTLTASLCLFLVTAAGVIIGFVRLL